MGCVQARQPVLATPRHGALGGPHHEGRQQPLGPLRRFEPRRMRVALSGAFSPWGHYCPWVFRRLERHGSTFLHPFAPPELPGFFATMGALTPGRLAPRLPREPEHPLWHRPGLPAFCHRIVRSFRLQPPAAVPTPFWVLRAGRTGPPCGGRPFRGRASVGLRHWGAGSPRRQAESSSRALRTNRSPPVALHPASRRRSYLQLRGARTSRQGLSPC